MEIDKLLPPDAEARQVASTIVEQFEMMETLGAFVKEDVTEQKILFASLALRNYAANAVQRLGKVPPNEVIR